MSRFCFKREGEDPRLTLGLAPSTLIRAELRTMIRGLPEAPPQEQVSLKYDELRLFLLFAELNDLTEQEALAELYRRAKKRLGQ